MVSKFPAALVDGRFAFFFLPLAARLAGEPAPVCRRRVAAALGSLLRRVTADSRSTAAEWARKWLASGDVRLRAAGAQVRSSHSPPLSDSGAPPLIQWPWTFC